MAVHLVRRRAEDEANTVIVSIWNWNQGHRMNEERLVNIEAKITFQEDLIEELNKTVYQQQQRLERLEAACEALARQVRSVAEARNEGMPANERPPHY